MLGLYDIAEGKAVAGPGNPTVVLSMDRFGPLNLLPRTGKQWVTAARREPKGSTRSSRRRRIRATYRRTQGARHLLAALDMKPQQAVRAHQGDKNCATFLEFCRYLRSPCAPQVRIAIVMDNVSPHLSINKDGQVGEWAAANNVELGYVPTNASFLNRIGLGPLEMAFESRVVVSPTFPRSPS